MSQPAKLFLSMPHACSYLEDRLATTAFLDPALALSRSDYSILVAKGFRRSGAIVYRPACRECSACVSVRIKAAKFKPNRSQRRCLRRNEDLVVTRVAADYYEEHFALYRRYQGVRHCGGSMDNDDPVQYRQFLLTSQTEIAVYEIRDTAKKLMAVAVSDVLDDGLSAVYSFFDPKATWRGLGTYIILWQLNTLLQTRLEHLYLGYWIAECPKMSYKTRFQPIEVYINGHWQDLLSDD